MPRARSSSSGSSPKSSPTVPTTRTSVKKLAARAKWTAEPPSILSRSPNGVCTASKAIEPTTVSGIARPSCQTCALDARDSSRRIRGPRGDEPRRAARSRARRRHGRRRRRARGINFADTHATRDDYLAKQSLPMIPGGEIAGTTPDGRRVAAILAGGGYAEKVAVPEGWTVPLRDGISDDQAAALLLQGLTAHALVHRFARLEPGETIVVEAAGGGTGTLAVQLAKRAGARVIALASTEEKRDLAEPPRRRRDGRLARGGPRRRDPRGQRRRAGGRSARDVRGPGVRAAACEP